MKKIYAYIVEPVNTTIFGIPYTRLYSKELDAKEKAIDELGQHKKERETNLKVTKHGLKR